MKKHYFLEFWNSTIRIACLILIIMTGLSCSGGGDDNGEGNENDGGPDLSAIEGRYTGSLVWPLGSGPVSMVVSPSSTNRYSVDFYETASFTPMFQTDGVTPEAIGTLEVNGDDATIDLVLRTDFPPCTGRYGGPGTRTKPGTFVFNNFAIVHDCAVDGEGTVEMTKISD